MLDLLLLESCSHGHQHGSSSLAQFYRLYAAARVTRPCHTTQDSVLAVSCSLDDASPIFICVPYVLV